MRRVLWLLLVSIVVIFTVQNHEVMEIQFMTWTFVMSRAAVIFLALGIGVLIGWLPPFGARHTTPSQLPQGGRES